MIVVAIIVFQVFGVLGSVVVFCVVIADLDSVDLAVSNITGLNSFNVCNGFGSPWDIAAI